MPAASGTYIVVTIDEVDLANRLVHALDKTNSTFQCTFREGTPGWFYIPQTSEQWTAILIGKTWHLDKLLDTPDQQTWAAANLQPGDVRISGNNFYFNEEQIDLTGKSSLEVAMMLS